MAVKIKIPEKPFPNYRWRWATLTPTENLNDPAVFIGVLRVFRRFEGMPPSSPELRDALQVVQDETETSVDLVRTAERNLIRNSGQYWRGLGLLAPVDGEIRLTSFGRALADGQISQVEFAATVVKTLEIPNALLNEDLEEWRRAELSFRPLQLILDVISELNKFSSQQAFLTPSELVSIVIPLAGVKAKLNLYAEALLSYRNETLDVSGWPDCAPGANDKRMAREFLLFLSNYNLLQRQSIGRKNSEEIYSLSGISISEIAALHDLQVDSEDREVVARNIRISHIPENIERKVVARRVLERPYQAAFRRNVLNAYNSTCLITGVKIESVLEAAHIRPVSNNGSDQIDNGICLRSDIHQLFDTGHLKISPSGDITLSQVVLQSNAYSNLPLKISLPDFVSKENLHFKFEYT